MSIGAGSRVLATIGDQDFLATAQGSREDGLRIIHLDPLSPGLAPPEQVFPSDHGLLAVSEGVLHLITDRESTNLLEALNSARTVLRATIDQGTTRGHVLTVAQALCDMLRGMGMPQMADTLASEATELTSLPATSKRQEPEDTFRSICPQRGVHSDLPPVWRDVFLTRGSQEPEKNRKERGK